MKPQDADQVHGLYQQYSLLLEENESLKADLKLVNSCWQTDMIQIRDLE